MRLPPLRSTLFPYTTLFRSRPRMALGYLYQSLSRWNEAFDAFEGILKIEPESWEDRKSTRLNSSHRQISYAVFCLKKKSLGRSSPPAGRPPTRRPPGRAPPL